MKHVRNFMTAAIIAAILAASAPTALTGNQPLPPAEASASITARDLKKHLGFLASDELGGRYTLSPSIRIAARYLATQLDSLGYQGGARDKTFFQRVPLKYRTIDFKKSGATLSFRGSRQDFKYADDFISMSPAMTSLSGELAFAGYGISAPAKGHDDYAGLNVKGKIVVVFAGAPDSLKGVKLEEIETGEAAAINQGATGIIVIAPHYLLMWSGLKSAQDNEEQIGLPPRRTSSRPGLSVIYAGAQMIKALAKVMGKEESYLMSPPGMPLEPAALPASIEVKIDADYKDAPLAQNVVGILEGSDPKLKDEYVVVSAHYDHLETTEGGEVFNGADDDGSGTAAVLEIAEALALGPRPKRSVLIIFHTGEEIGLFGSEFNTDYEPVVALDRLVANLNIDMIGRSRAPGNQDSRDKMLTDKDSIYIIGSDKLSTELHRLNEQTNGETARMKFDYTYNADNHPERFYYRSDHYNYAKHGVPVIFYFTGVHRDYHRTTDDLDKIDFAKMERITRMIFATGWRIANLDHRLVVDKKPASVPAR